MGIKSAFLIRVYLIRKTLTLTFILFFLSILFLLLEGVEPNFKNITLLLTLGYVPKGLFDTISLFLMFVFNLFPLMAIIETISTPLDKKAEVKAMFLEDHIIIVGAGRLGRRVINLAKDMGFEFSVIVKREDLEENDFIRGLLNEGFPVVFGDARLKETLLKAGITKAKAVIVTVDDDNLNVVLLNKCAEINPKVKVISRIFNEDLEEILRRMYSKNEILSTYDLSNEAFLFSVFFNIAPEASPLTIEADSILEGVEIGELRKNKIEIIALKRNEWIIPNDEYKIKKGDILLVDRKKENIKRFILFMKNREKSLKG